MGAAIEPGRRVDLGIGAMADACIYLPQSINESDILKHSRGRKTTCQGIDAGGAGERGTKVLQVTGPGIGRIGIQDGFQLRDHFLELPVKRWYARYVSGVYFASNAQKLF